MKNNKYVIFSDDTPEMNNQFEISKEDEKKIENIIEKAITDNK